MFKQLDVRPGTNMTKYIRTHYLTINSKAQYAINYLPALKFENLYLNLCHSTSFVLKHHHHKDKHTWYCDRHDSMIILRSYEFSNSDKNTLVGIDLLGYGIKEKTCQEASSFSSVPISFILSINLSKLITRP